MNTIPLVNNAAKLISVFGEWPSFHDAEVLKLELERRPPSLTLTVLIRRNIREEPADKSYFKVTGSWVVTLRFQRIDDVVLENFNHQNVITEIVIKARAPQGLEVLIEPILGFYGKFVCESAEVIEIESVPA